MSKPTRMFQSVTRTWNPAIGCLHDCTYCWARDLALGRLKHHEKYSQGFKPRFFPDELLEPFRPGEFIFVSSMGDLFGQWVLRSWINAILEVIRDNPGTDFLLQTKNPVRYIEFDLPPNVYAGVTLESDVPFDVSKAPSVFRRYRRMLELPPNTRKFVSIEPIMDFTIDGFTTWIADIKPDIVEVGADNHHKNLPEPSGEKVTVLLTNLRHFGLNVIEKPGLERLLKEAANV